jgi:RimJ/RimL family protein N-acetyltransferase
MPSPFCVRQACNAYICNEYDPMLAALDGTITTQRLLLRPIAGSDAADVLALAGDWEVARMLADMPYPLTAELAHAWTQTAAGDVSYAITLDDGKIGGGKIGGAMIGGGKIGGGKIGGAMIGGVSLCRIDDDGAGAPVELGFWLGQRWWGRGFAREAAAAVIAQTRIGDKTRDTTRDKAGESGAEFHSGHFADNPASGRVLDMLGFTSTGVRQQWCLARQQVLPAVRYRLPVAGPVAVRGHNVSGRRSRFAAFSAWMRG